MKGDRVSKKSLEPNRFEGERAAGLLDAYSRPPGERGHSPFGIEADGAGYLSSDGPVCEAAGQRCRTA